MTLNALLRGRKKRKAPRSTFPHDLSTDTLAAIYTAVIAIVEAAETISSVECGPSRYPLRNRVRELFSLGPFKAKRDWIEYADARQELIDILTDDLRWNGEHR